VFGELSDDHEGCVNACIHMPGVHDHNLVVGLVHLLAEQATVVPDLHGFPELLLVASRTIDVLQDDCNSEEFVVSFILVHTHFASTI